jgi:hypothetical protein
MASRRGMLENIPAQVLVLDDVRKLFSYIHRIDADRLLFQVRASEGNLFQHFLHDGMKTPGADIFRILIDDGRKVRDLLNRVVGERQLDSLRIHQRDILLNQGVFRLFENSDKIRFG